MADSDSFNKPRFRASDLSSPIQPNTSKSYTHFLFKSLVVLFVLVLLPLFPSQAPEFIGQTILTKMWELLHLLFIGIAVCYGLFSRRNVERNSETYSKIDNSHTYLSGILHASSIFDDGLENPCGSDEKRMLQTWNSQYFQGESMVVAAQENYVSDQWGKHGPRIDHKPLGLPIRSLKSRVVDTDSLDSINGSGSSSSLKDSSRSSDKIRNGKTRGMDPINMEEKFKETVVLSSPIPWRLRSGRMEMGEEIVIVKPRSHSRPPSVGEFEFGSLKSRSSRSSSVSSQPSSVSSSPKKSESIKPPSHSRPPSVGEFEFESLKSRSSRSSVSSQTSSVSSSPKKSESIKPPSHSRPPSVGEFEFESLKSRSSRSSVSSQTSSVSSSPKKSESIKPPSRSRPPSVGEFEFESLKSWSPRSSVSSQTSYLSSSPRKSESPISPEVSTSKMEDLERKKCFNGTSEPALHLPLAPINGEAPFITSKARRFSIGSSSEMNVPRSFGENLKDLSKREDPLGRGKSGVDSFNSEMKHTIPAKGLSRGKSVRTIRASKHVVETMKKGEIHPNHIDGKAGKRCDNFEAISMENIRRAGFENPPFNSGTKNLDNLCHMPNSSFSEYHNGEKQEFVDRNVVESEKDSESEFDNFQLSSDKEETESDIISDAELGPSEVDRKAGEFIAKFREQIRLQRIASIRG